MMRRLALLCAWAVLAWAGGAHADGPLGANATRIRTSNYALDLTAGPVVLGTRAIGLGGAYVAIAEGVDGNTQNPAAPAVRSAWSEDHVDYDIGVGVAFPATLSSTDYFNTGRGPTDLRHSEQTEFTLLSPAVNVQIGHWGVGMALDLQRYGLLRRPDPEQPGQEQTVRAQISVLRTYLARAVDDGQLVGGLGFHVTALDVTTRNEIITRSGNVFTTRGVNLEGGMLWRPNDQPFRFGFAIRAPVITAVEPKGEEYAGGDVVVGDPSSPDAIWLPKRVKRPWSADVGIALSIGSRPLNPPWIDPVLRQKELDGWLRHRDRDRAKRLREALALGPDYAAAVAEDNRVEHARDLVLAERAKSQLHERLRQRYLAMPRPYVLISAALHADGRVSNAVGVESLLQQVVDRSGELATISPRLGVETEPVLDWVKLRAGSYLEPTRFRGSSDRAHGTFGFDARLFDWSVFGLAEEHTHWRVGGAIDVSRAYLGWGVSVGVWR